MLPTSLARPAKHAFRGVALNLLGGVRQQPLWRRNLVTFHDAKGKFVTIDHFGALVSKDITISRGSEDESFVMMDREVGLAMRSAIMRQIGVSLISDPEAIPLRFYHTSLHFAHELLPYPRLIIDKGLAGLDSSNVSAATLWLFGRCASEFTLDGTPDHDFTLSSRESQERLKGVLEELKDR